MLAQDRMIAFETHNFLLEQEVKKLEMDLEVYEELIAENDEHRELWEKAKTKTIKRLNEIYGWDITKNDRPVWRVTTR